MKRIAQWGAVVLLAVVMGGGTVAAIAASDDTTGTNVACATATIPDRTHTVGVDGTAIDTITDSGTSVSSCTTQTYDIPTSTETQTVTGPSTSTSSTSSQTTTSSTSSAPASGFTPLHVAGNKLQNASGQDVRLIGTEESGSAYACEQNGGYGFTDTQTGNAMYGPMTSNDGGALPAKWPINSFALGLNQDCWLGINGVPAKYSGQNYINFVKAEVTSMEAHDIYPVIYLSVGEPGTDTPNWSSTGNGNAPMPDADHVPLLWQEVANEFKSDPDVIFRLYEEPWPEFDGSVNAAWQCWSQGDVQFGTGSDNALPSGWESSPGAQVGPTSTSSNQGCNPLDSDGNGHTYSAVGFQSLMNIVRGTGATNIVQVPGIAFANALTCTNSGDPTTCGFLQPGVKVTDPLATTNPGLGSQMMADTDNYPDTGQFVNSVTSVQDTYGPVERVMPIDMGEAGVVGNPASFPLIQGFVGQYDAWGQSYYLSQWETWANLISDYNGTPDTACGHAAPGGCWGSWIYDELTGATL